MSSWCILQQLKQKLNHQNQIQAEKINVINRNHQHNRTPHIAEIQQIAHRPKYDDGGVFFRRKTGIPWHRDLSWMIVVLFAVNGDFPIFEVDRLAFLI
jgi:hypothetical protein